jgi:hypothetical protein
MSRLSAVGSIPIADRIKAFDNGSSKSKPRKVTSPPPKNSQPSSPLFKTFPRTQFSAKDPTRPSPPPTNPPSRSTSRSSLGSASSLGRDDYGSTPPPASSAPVKNILKSTSTHSVVTSSRTEKSVVTVEKINENDSSGSCNARNLSNSHNGNNFDSLVQTSNQYPNSYSKLKTVKEDAGDVFVKGDTVDRAKPRRSVIEVCQESPIPVPSDIRDDVVLVNNNKSTLRNANSNSVPNFWAKPSNGTTEQHETPPAALGAREDKIYSFSSDSEELPSFSSSVTDDGEMREMRDLRKAKREVDMRLVEREDQVDDLAQQVEMLLSLKARLEAEISQCRKEHKREVCGCCI